MAKAFVQCRICKQRFDRKDPNLVEGVDYVKPSERMYYHKKCYEEYQASKLDIHASMADEIWFSAAWDFLRKELKYSFNFVKVRKQWDSFLKNKLTAKGMYFALKYFYEIKKGDVEKSENGIGIIPHIYADSCEYWFEREKRTAGICAAIEEQILAASKQNTINVRLRRPKKNAKTAAQLLAEIEELEED